MPLTTHRCFPVCDGDPAEAGAAQNRTGNVTGLIGNTLQYVCADSMTTEDGLTEQNMTCSEEGWTQPPAPCDRESDTGRYGGVEGTGVERNSAA